LPLEGTSIRKLPDAQYKLLRTNFCIIDRIGRWGDLVYCLGGFQGPFKILFWDTAFKSGHIVSSPRDLLGTYLCFSVQREENMSRIHEALKKAEEERNGDQVADAMTLSLGAAGIRLVAEKSTHAETTETLTRNGIVIPPPSRAHLRFDAVVAHCAHPEWHRDPNTSVFLNSAAGTHTAEQFRTLRSRLFQIRGNQPTYTLLVTSSLPDEGKTFVASNLAQAIMQQPHHRTLIIDADLRYPQLHLALGAPLAPGLTDYLCGEADEVSVIQNGDEENLCFIPGGRHVTNPSELLSNGRLKTLLDRLTPIFDWIILDSPPCLPVADAILLASFCNGVLLVIRAGSTPVEGAQKVCQQMQGKNIVGVVLNGVEQDELSGSQSYGYGYGISNEATGAEFCPLGTKETAHEPR
jgi:capsular exopolysaccharide synthesis family protein